MAEKSNPEKNRRRRRWRWLPLALAPVLALFAWSAASARGGGRHHDSKTAEEARERAVWANASWTFCALERSGSTKEPSSTA